MRTCEAGPDRDLVALGERGADERTRAQLAAAVARISASLGPLACRRPLITCTDRFHLLATLLACWSNGLVPILPQNDRIETCRALLSGGLADGWLHEGGMATGVNVAELGAMADAGSTEHSPRCAGDFDRCLADRGASNILTLYTSGSTGQPVPVQKTAGQLFGEAAVLIETFGIRPKGHVIATAPGQHIYGLLFGILVPYMAGSAFVRSAPLDPERVAALVRRHEIELLCAVPAHLSVFGDLSAGAMPSLTRVFSSGAPLPAATASDLKVRFGVVVTEVLGSSESGGIAWRDVGNDRAGDEAPDWRPLPGVAVQATDEGTLLLDSPFLHPSWPRPWRAADRIALRPGGGFRFLGRSDGVLKIAGRRVSLADVEARLRAIDGVADAAILALPQSGPRQHELCAAVVAPGLTTSDLRRGLSRWFDPVAIPRQIQLVDRLPREQNGKLSRASLVALFVVPAQSTDVTAREELS